MHIHRSLSQLPAFRKAVLTIGTFDGVHNGHRQIIRQLIGEAALAGGESVLITFHPHPRSIVELSNPKPVHLLSTLEEKLNLLARLGLDHVVVVPFDAAFARQTAEEYIEDFLWMHFHPATLIIGYDHKFGKGRKGDFHLLGDYGRRLGFAVKEIPAELNNEVAISSTRIREAIGQSDIALANHLLGYAYTFSGLVVKGNQLGRTIGFPTANLRLDPEKLTPGGGVYAVTCVLEDGKRYNGMMNVGWRPTVDGKNKTVEVHLLDFDADIYGQTMQVTIHQYLRAEQKFNGLDALKQQLAADRTQAAAVLAGL